MHSNKDKMEKISSDFPYRSKYANVLGSKLHYIDENTGNENQISFVCIHGNPSSSYLWRNIIPYLLPHGRVIAPDLIGFGKSDKPDIDYRVLTHEKYLSAFINGLGLNNIVFVLHDWGAALGLAYARQHENNVKGIALMEGVISPKKWDFGNIFVRLMFRAMRTKGLGKWMVVNHNFFVERILLFLGTKRKLSVFEKAYYRKPFKMKKDRIPTYVFPNEIPIKGKPENVNSMVLNNHEWLHKTNLPKLLLWVKPGVLVKEFNAMEMKRKYPNFHDVLLGNSSKFPRESHYVQEDFPDEIGNAIIKWIQTF